MLILEWLIDAAQIVALVYMAWQLFTRLKAERDDALEWMSNVDDEVGDLSEGLTVLQTSVKQQDGKLTEIREIALRAQESRREAERKMIELIDRMQQAEVTLYSAIVMLREQQKPKHGRRYYADDRMNELWERVQEHAVQQVADAHALLAKYRPHRLSHEDRDKLEGTNASS